MRTDWLQRTASILLLVVACGAGLACRSTGQEGFATPEAAMRELADVIGSHDEARTERLLGEDGLELLSSGDDVADREDAERVQQYIREKLAFEERGPDTRVALVGNEGWPFPIPLVHEDGTWRFDVEAGVEEIANRRVGRNELSAIASMHEYVDAQREYASASRDGAAPAYARTIFSSEGHHDGLYWPTAEGEPESPLGPLMAEAALEGYAPGEKSPQPFHGYYYRVLLEQGPKAPGGARSFLDEKGRMTRGFALLAWPAKYGNSGVMTFQVNQQGIVYQRDLGEKTETQVAKIKAYSPDESWDPTEG
jgi:hypothetical protein